MSDIVEPEQHEADDMVRAKKPKEQPAGRKWISYRPEINVVDCTVRDGGLMNDHKFTDEAVRAIYEANVAAGVDYMEFGYKGDVDLFSDGDYGAWKFCSEESLRRIVGENDTELKISVMADAERTNYKRDLLPVEESVIDMVRVATYIHQIPVALDMIKDAHDKGYVTAANLMAISTLPEYELDEAIEILANSEVDVIYLVDSFGALYSEQVHYLIRKYLDACAGSGKQVGMHAHNNLQLGFANTIEAVIEGANYLDGSIAGLGRGAGNCPLEMLLGFLHNPKFHMRPVLRCIQDTVEPLRAALGWGYDTSYMVTGFMNQHPRAAIAHNASPDKENIIKFYDEITGSQ